MVHDNFAFMGTGLSPVAFFPASRTLVFMANDNWVYSTQIARGVPHTEGGEPLPLAASHRAGPPRPEGSSLRCDACGRRHRFLATRHFYALVGYHWHTMFL